MLYDIQATRQSIQSAFSDFEQESFLSLSTHNFLPNTILDSDVIETSIVEFINDLFYLLFKVAHV
ncbi:MAG: hypothetical protein IPN26_11855 [Bacteroidetes bacterium]|nr:hypothetical protein [Bacteroidota bacterium]